MAKKVYEEAKIAAIADKIREKTGGTETYTTAQMPSGVDTVYAKGETEGYSNGYSVGETEGYTQGYTEGETAGIEAGKKAEYDRFWDEFQQNGNRTDYTYGFSGNGWTDDTFVPKYDIRPTNASYIFINSRISNLKAACENAGITLDMSNTTLLTYFSQYSLLTHIPTLDFRNVGNLSYLFLGNFALIEIEKIQLKDDGSQTFSAYSFNNNTALKEVRFEGVIGRSGINLQHSTKLSRDSIVSIINALSATETGQSITLSKTAKEAAFTAEEWSTLVATKPNWTISLV